MGVVDLSLRSKTLLSCLLATLLPGCSAEEDLISAIEQTDNTAMQAGPVTQETTDPLASGFAAPGTVTDDVKSAIEGGSCRISAQATTPVATTINGEELIAAEAPTVTVSDAPVNCDDYVDELPGPGFGDLGEGSLTKGDDQLSITTVTANYKSTGSDFTQLKLHLHDGETRSLVQQSTVGGNDAKRIDWALYNISFSLFLDLTYTGVEPFEGGSFEFYSGTEISTDVIPEDLEQTNYVIGGMLFIDQLGDGDATMVEEVSVPVSGNINITGESPDWSVEIDLTLDNGTNLTGSYTGSFYVLPSLQDY